MTSCEKTPLDTGAHYLRLNYAYTNITNNQGVSRTFVVESDINWQLTVTPPTPDWMILDKYAGNGTQTITVTATRDNTTGSPRFAEVIARPVNNVSILPVRLTIVQNDSTSSHTKGFNQ